MTATHPSPEAMEAALLVCGHYHGEDLNRQAREHYKRVGCGRCSSIARALDAFARARVEEEREAFGIVLDALEINLRSNPVTKTAWLECDQTNTSDEEAVAAYRAISARRGRG